MWPIRLKNAAIIPQSLYSIFTINHILGFLLSCDIDRESTVKSLYVLQKRGLIEYSLSLPAVYVTVDVQACSEGQRTYRTYVDSDAAAAVGPLCTSTVTYTAGRDREYSISPLF